MSFELFVARRYLTARRKQAFISVITLISVVGIAIGVAAPVIAIALITGFLSDVQHKILARPRISWSPTSPTTVWPIMKPWRGRSEPFRASRRPRPKPSTWS